MENFEPEEIETALLLSSPKLLVADRCLLNDTLEIVHIDDLVAKFPLPLNDKRAQNIGLFRLLWTSGSTGFPKQTAWKQDKFVSERKRWLKDVDISKEDIFFCRHTLDVAHATDLHVFAALLSGAELVLADTKLPPNQLLRQIEDCGATAMSALPSHYAEYIQAGEEFGSPNLSRMRRPLCGGAYLSPLIIKKAYSVLGIHIRQIYGSTEFGLALGNMNDVLQTNLKMTPVRGVKVRIQPFSSDNPDLGELVLSSKCTSEGYLNNKKAHDRTFRMSEFWTGDLARRDNEDSYQVLGRFSEILKTPEGPIATSVLDEEIAACSLVAESVCMPIFPGEYRNEVCIVVCPFLKVLTDEVLKAVRTIICKYDLKHEIHFVDIIPRTPVGKPNKAVIRKTWIDVSERNEFNE